MSRCANEVKVSYLIYGGHISVDVLNKFTCIFQKWTVLTLEKHFKFDCINSSTIIITQ